MWVSTRPSPKYILLSSRYSEKKLEINKSCEVNYSKTKCNLDVTLLQIFIESGSHKWEKNESTVKYINV